MTRYEITDCFFGQPTYKNTTVLPDVPLPKQLDDDEIIAVIKECINDKDFYLDKRLGMLQDLQHAILNYVPLYESDEYGQTKQMRDAKSFRQDVLDIIGNELKCLWDNPGFYWLSCLN